MYELKRGDAGNIGVPIKIGPDKDNLQQVTAEDLPLFHCIEFAVGDYIFKKWPDEVVFADGKFLVPYTQEESFQFDEGETVKVDVRVHFETNGAADQVKGTKIRQKIKVVGTNSEEVLT